MYQNPNQSFGDWLRNLAEAAAIGAIFLLIMRGFVMLAALVLPKGRDGQPNKGAVVVVALLMLVASIAALNAAIMPKYHPIVNASPVEQRLMMQRKCVIQTFDTFNLEQGQTVPPDSFAWAHCVDIDAPDLPADMRGWLMLNHRLDARDLLFKRGIQYRSSTILIGQAMSTDPTKFHGPTWMWADGTRPRTEKYWYF